MNEEQGRSPDWVVPATLVQGMTANMAMPKLGLRLLHGYKNAMTPPPIRQPVRILGIDPGLRRTGWGIIESEGNRLIFVGCGSVEPPDNLSLAERLLAIHEGLAAVLGNYRPAEAAV